MDARGVLVKILNAKLYDIHSITAYGVSFQEASGREIIYWRAPFLCFQASLSALQERLLHKGQQQVISPLFFLSFIQQLFPVRLSFHRDPPEALFPFKFHPVRNYNCAMASFPIKTHVVVKGNHDLVPSFLWTWSYWIWNETVWSANTLKHQDFTSKLTLCFFLKFSVLIFFFCGEIDGHINEANKQKKKLVVFSSVYDCLIRCETNLLLIPD